MNEAFIWVLKIIASCNNPFHIDCAKAVIKCFAAKYGEDEALELELKLSDIERIIKYE